MFEVTQETACLFIICVFSSWKINAMTFSFWYTNLTTSSIRRENAEIEMFAFCLKKVEFSGVISGHFYCAKC